MLRGGMTTVGVRLVAACMAVSSLLAIHQAPGSLPTESDLLAKPGLVRTWSERLQANAPAIREKAAAELTQGGANSLPLLRHVLLSSDERLRKEAFEIIRRIGADALPLLTELLGWDDVLIPRDAISVMIDLAPDTETAQPALVRALNGDDLRVARDAARALGALGERASSSVPALVKALSHQDSAGPELCGGGVGIHRPGRGPGDARSDESPSRPGSRRAMGRRGGTGSHRTESGARRA